MTVVTIDSEFMGLCPTQTEEELALLRKSLKEEGCTHPIVYWNTEGNPIVDGMTRFRMCSEENIPFQVRQMEFPDRRAARIWIRVNQLSRRNLSDTQRAIIRGQLYNEMKCDPLANLSHGANSNGEDVDDKAAAPEKEHHVPIASEEIAAADNVSAAKVRRDGSLASAYEKLTPLAKTLIHGTKAGDTASGIKQLAELAPKQQEKVADLIAKDKAKTVKKAKELAGIADTTKPRAPKPRKPGVQSKDWRVWRETEKLLGTALNRVDALNKQFSSKPLYTSLLREIKQAMATLEAWEAEARKDKS